MTFCLDTRKLKIVYLAYFCGLHYISVGMFCLLPPVLSFILFSNQQPVEMLFKLWHAYAWRWISILLRIKDEVLTVTCRAPYNTTLISSVISSPTTSLLVFAMPATLVFWLIAEFHFCCLWNDLSPMKNYKACFLTSFNFSPFFKASFTLSRTWYHSFLLQFFSCYHLPLINIFCIYVCVYM